MVAFPSLTKQDWPRELRAGELDTFYGNPRGSGGANPAWEAENLTSVTPPWQMMDGGTRVSHITIHKKCADSLTRVLNAVWNYVGQDQAKINASHLNEWGGSYNYRTNVNAPSKLSLHAYAAAVDIAPSENPNGKRWTDDGRMLPRWLIDAFLAEGWSWGGDFNVTKDAMHFQATFNTHADAPQDQPKSLPIVPLPSVGIPVPQVALTADDQLTRMRKFLLDETGIPAEIEAFKASVTADLAALTAKVQAFTLQAQMGVAQPAPTTIVIPAPIIVPRPAPPPVKFAGITATVFGGAGDKQGTAYADVATGWANRPGVALPYRFKGKRPKVGVWNVETNRGIVCDIVDVGPWNINDPYWQTNKRPQAETGTDTTGRHTNGAGIDLTPAAAQAIGLDGKGKVDWNFITTQETAMTDGTTPTQVTVPVTSPLASKINWTQLLAMAATLLTVISGGKYNLDPALQASIVTVISAVTGIATIAFRTFGTTSITPQSLPKS